jgi:hypothetical protein
MARYPTESAGRMDQQFAETAAERNARLARKRPKRCAECDKEWADPPSRLCPGCQAYRDHTGHW